VSATYGAKGCDKWEEGTYVSTIIKDYDNNYATVTKTKQPLTVYHTKKIITHSATGFSTPTGGYATPTGTAYKNGTEGCWYELYEKIEEVPYNKLGPHALPGYPGSGLYKEGEKKQPVHVKEYKGGKWSEYDHEYSYGSPQPEVTTYEKPGVYTVSSKDVTVNYPVTYPAEATTTAKAGETCTFGGQYIEAKQTGYVTGAYGAYETKVDGGKTVTETVVKHTTIYASTTGKYEIAIPTTTVYDHDTEIAYPTAKHYEAGVYHHEAQTVTITKGGQAYTCEYEQTKKYEATSTPKKDQQYPAHPTSTPVQNNSYDHGKPSATPKKPTEGEDKYPTYPGNSKPSSFIHGAYPASTSAAVVAASSKPYEAAKSTPVYSDSHYSSSTSCTDEAKHYATPIKSSVYNTVVPSAAKSSIKEYAHPSSTSVYGAEHSSVKPSSTSCTDSATSSATHIKSSVYSTAVYGHPSSTPAKSSVYESKEYAHPSSTPVYEHSSKASSTSCTDSLTPSATPAKSSVYETKEYVHPSATSIYEHSTMATSTSCTDSLTSSATPAVSSVYSTAVPSTMLTSTSCTNSETPSAKPVKSSVYNTEVYGHPTSTLVASSAIYTPIAATSTPCSTDAYGHATSTPVAPAHPDPSSDYDQPIEKYGKIETGYTKRDGLIQRRKVVVAKSKRTILL
jgi:hypothetical protein